MAPSKSLELHLSYPRHPHRLSYRNLNQITDAEVDPNFGRMGEPARQNSSLNQNDLHNIETVTSEKRQPEATPPLLSRAYIFGPVKKSHGDLALLACCLVTGMVDAASFSNWGAFVGMQTGRTTLKRRYIENRLSTNTTRQAIQSFSASRLPVFQLTLMPGSRPWSQSARSYVDAGAHSTFQRHSHPKISIPTA